MIPPDADGFSVLLANRRSLRISPPRDDRDDVYHGCRGFHTERGISKRGCATMLHSIREIEGRTGVPPRFFVGSTSQLHREVRLEHPLPISIAWLHAVERRMPFSKIHSLGQGDESIAAQKADRLKLLFVAS